MDLALENRIDTDLDSLILLDDTPTGDSLLDPTSSRSAGTTLDSGLSAPLSRRKSCAKRLCEGLLRVGFWSRSRIASCGSSNRGDTQWSMVRHNAKSSCASWASSSAMRYPTPRYRNHLSRRRLRDIQIPSVCTRARIRHTPHRPGPTARPHRPIHDPSHRRHRTHPRRITSAAHVLISGRGVPTEDFLEVGEVFGEGSTSDHRRLNPRPGFLIVELFGHVQILGVFELSKVGRQISAG
jgi:hypothetical protein